MERKRMSTREGKLYLDGEEVMDMITTQVNITPEVAESRACGQRGKSRKWVGHDITGSFSQYRTNAWMKEAIKQYIKDGITPVFTYVGMQDDPDSYYSENYGSTIVTLEGLVITGDINLINLDAEGELVIDEIEFGAEDIILK